MYEITVPLVVKVDAAGKVTGHSIERGFPGFFSEAADVGGCWNVETQEWDEPVHVEPVVAAWKYVRDGLDASQTK